MVIGYFTTVNNAPHIRNRIGRRKRQQLCRLLSKSRNAIRHIFGQVIGIRARIGQQFLLIKRLCVVQDLLRRITEQPVAVPLQGGEVVQFRRTRCLLRLLHSGYGEGLSLAGGTQLVRVLALCKAV